MQNQNIKFAIAILAASLICGFISPTPSYCANFTQVFKNMGKIFARNPAATSKSIDTSRKEINKKIDEKKKMDMEIEKFIQQYSNKK